MLSLIALLLCLTSRLQNSFYAVFLSYSLHTVHQDVPFAISDLDRSFSPVKPKWLELRCHNHELSLIMAFKHFGNSVLISNVNSLFLYIFTFAMTLSSLFLIVKARSLRRMSQLFPRSCPRLSILLCSDGIQQTSYIQLCFQVLV